MDRTHFIASIAAQAHGRAPLTDLHWRLAEGMVQRVQAAYPDGQIADRHCNPAGYGHVLDRLRQLADGSPLLRDAYRAVELAAVIDRALLAARQAGNPDWTLAADQAVSAAQSLWLCDTTQSQ